jgi:hypothetical protein
VSSGRRLVSRDELRALLGRRIGPVANRWSTREVIHYALASGAGREHIEYVYEGYGPKILPTFPIFAAGPWTAAAVELFPDGACPVYAGFCYDFHHQVQLNGEVSAVGEVVCIDFHETSALVWLRVASSAASRVVVGCLSPLHVNIERGARHTVGICPDTIVVPVDGDLLEPLSLTVDTRATLLYHLLLPFSGKAPSPDAFHLDRAEARRRGLADTPLHGAGVTGHLGLLLAVAACKYAAGTIVQLGGRFAAPVFPGDTLILRLWRPKVGSNRWPLQLENGRGEVIIAKAWVQFRESEVNQ